MSQINVGISFCYLIQLLILSPVTLLYYLCASKNVYNLMLEKNTHFLIITTIFILLLPTHPALSSPLMIE